MMFAETSEGENNITGKKRSKLGLKRGDYLKVLSEKENGELRESIFRLI